MEGDIRVGLRGDGCEIARIELSKFRTRWHRWLGQKCRVDKPYWVTLLDTNWLGWADKVINEKCPNRTMRDKTRDDIKEWFSVAITFADMRDLHRLDELYVTDKMRL